MTDEQEDKLGMFEKVASFLDTKATELAGVTQIAGIKTELDDNIEAIVDEAGVATSDTTGFTDEKAQERVDLEVITLKVSRAAAAYFLSIGSLGSIKLADYIKSDLEGSRDNDLYVKAKYLYKKALVVQASLSGFNSGPADVTALNDALVAFFDVIQLPAEKRGEKVVSGVEVDELFQQTDLLLDQLDIYMLTFEAVDNELFLLYLQARAIDNSGGGSGTDTNVLTGTVGMGTGVNIPFDEEDIQADTNLLLTNLAPSGGPIIFFFSDTEGGSPGPSTIQISVTPGDTAEVIAVAAGYDIPRPLLNVYNPNATPMPWKAAHN
ncbi:MAG: hypothetical protein V4615_04300 [Bacteroidota bacterium]